MTQLELAQEALDLAIKGRDARVLELIQHGYERDHAESIVSQDIAGLVTRRDNLRATMAINAKVRAQRVAAVMADIPAEGELLTYG